MARGDDVEVSVMIHHETEAAYLVSDDGESDNAVWLPKSQLRSEAVKVENGEQWGEFTLPEWLAQEKGLI